MHSDMATTNGTAQQWSDRRYLIVSGDSHAQPSLETQMREYCPAKYREEFDAFVELVRAGEMREFMQAPPSFGGPPDTTAMSEEMRAAGLEILRRVKTNPGSNDATARLADMDADGIASELIFAGAQNGEVMPWAGTFDMGLARISSELRVVGGHMWNQWLADFVSAAPERLLGVAQIPIWDVDAAVKEVVWAKEHGLRALNFAAPRADYVVYNEEAHYAPFWSVVEESGLPLLTHSASGGEPINPTARGAHLVWLSEVLWHSRRGLSQLIFGGVFDRHPGLKLGFVEQRGNWVQQTLADLDSAHLGMPVNASLPLLGVPIDTPRRLPSEYWESNCMLVASFMAPFEAAMRHEIGLGNMMWGSDYPHLEGTFLRTHAALRNTFAGIPEADVRVILEDNGLRFFDLDRSALQPVADRIGPTARALSQPLAPEEQPAYRSFAFREAGSHH